MPEDYDFDHLPQNRADRARLVRDGQRQGRRRADMRARHAPDTHAVDRAVSQAVARLASRAGAQLGVDGLRDPAAVRAIAINYLAILAEAVNILCHRYNRAESHRAVSARIKMHRRHLDRLPPERNQD